MGFFSGLRDMAYKFVYREGEFSLQFLADLFRGPAKQKDQSKSQNKSQKAQAKTSLNQKEEEIFERLLKRKKNEEQVEYWKRKKALTDLSIEDKKAMIKKELMSIKQNEQVEKVVQQRQTEMQNRRKTESSKNQQNSPRHQR